MSDTPPCVGGGAVYGHSCPLCEGGEGVMTKGLTEEEYLRFREWAQLNRCGVAKFDSEVMTLLLDTIDALRARVNRKKIRGAVTQGTVTSSRREGRAK